MAVEKAKMQKIREDMLSGNGSKKAVYPKTIDKAVSVQNKDSVVNKYETLDTSLSKRWRTAWAYTISIGENSNEPAFAYYLFSFSNLVNKKEFQDYILCDYSTFRIKIEGSENEEDISLLEDFDTSISALSQEDLERRLEYKSVSKLVLDCIRLHDTALPEFVVIDEDGNEYQNGDTIELTEYPAKLKLKLKELPAEFLNTLASLVSNFSGDGWSYDFRFESSLEYSNYKIMETYVPTMANVAGAPNSLWHTQTYKNPLNYFTDYLLNVEYNIATINSLIRMALDTTLDFYVRPSDYPNVVNEEVLEEYCSHMREGILIIKDYATISGEPVRLPLYIKPIKIKLVFTPTSEFRYISPEEGEQFTLNKSNAFTNYIEFKAKNVDNEASININFGGVETNYAFYSSDGLTKSTSLNVTPTQLTNGYTVQIKPVDWTSDSKYLPFDTPTTDTVNIYCDYVLDGELERRTAVVKCVVTDSDIPKDSSMECTTREFNKTTRRGYLDIKIINGENNPIQALDITAWDATYYPLLANGWSTEGITITDDVIVTQNLGKVNGVFREEDYGPVKQTILYSEEDVEDMSFRVEIPNYDSHNNVINGRGQFKIYINGNGTSGELSGEYTLDFDTTVSDMVSPLHQMYNEWYENNRISTKYVAIDGASARIVNAIVNSMSEKVRDNVTSSSNTVSKETVDNTNELNSYIFSKQDINDTNILEVLSNLTEIPDGAFADNPNLTSVTIPSNIERIGWYAFKGCTNLEELVIPDSVTYIGPYLAYGCTALETIDLGVNIHSLKPYAFVGCPNLKTIISRQEEVDGLQTDVYIGKPIMPAFDEALDGADDVTIYCASDEVADAMTASIAADNQGYFYGNDFSNATILTIADLVE